MGQDNIQDISPDQASASVLSVMSDWHDVEKTENHALFKKAVSEQWHADDLNWAYPIDPARELFDAGSNPFMTPQLLALLGKSQREEFVVLSFNEQLSQILHGEQGAMTVSCSIAQRMPNLDGKLFAVSQAMDEARHIEVLSRYIGRLRGTCAPAPGLSRLLDAILNAKHWQEQLVGMHIVLEGLALRTFSVLRKSTNCDLLRELLRLVMRDEARHLAFGHNALKSILQAMHPDDRAEVEDFAVFLTRTLRALGQSKEDLQSAFANLVKVGIDPLDYIDMLKVKKGPQNCPAETGNGFDRFVIPAFQKVGLITDRVKPYYLAIELETANDLRALDDLEHWLRDSL